MTASDSGSDHRKPDLEKRLKNSVRVARVGAMWGALFAFFALDDMASRLHSLRMGVNACDDFGVARLELVEVLVCKPDIGWGWDVISIEFGIALEIVLILIFCARVFSGKGFISAVLLWILIGVEMAFQIAGSTGAEKLGVYLQSVSFAILVGLGVWGTWQYRRLSRKVEASPPETA